MLNLSTELIKNSTSLERIEHLDDLTAHLTGTDCEVWALRAGDTFPRHLIPGDSNGYLCYMIYPSKIAPAMGRLILTLVTRRISYGTDGNVDFSNTCMISTLKAKPKNIFKHSFDEQEVVLFPKVISESGVDYCFISLNI